MVRDPFEALNPNPVLISQIKLLLGLNPNDDIIPPRVDGGECLTCMQANRARLKKTCVPLFTLIKVPKWRNHQKKNQNNCWFEFKRTTIFYHFFFFQTTRMISWIFKKSGTKFSPWNFNVGFNIPLTWCLVLKWAALIILAVQSPPRP